jgi:hypothetical protein
VEDFATHAFNVSGLSQLNYVRPGYLDTDESYFWKVRADDGIDKGEYSDVWNLTVMSLTSINLTVRQVHFRVMDGAQSNDTTDDSPLPFRIQNTGNQMVNLSINATNSLFETEPLDRRFFQVKADEYKPNSFDAGRSATDWINVSEVIKSLIMELHFNDTKDEAEIDVRVEIPVMEPSADVKTNITLKVVA